ncbi:TMEM14-domain-containing protein, partial [Basidiobolus meristosporus CBS 931.73]
MSHHTTATLAGLCAIGGIVGYFKGRSKPSLIAGLTFGTLFGVSTYLLKENREYGEELAAATSVLLTGAMLPRGIRTRKPLPLALGTIGVLGAGYYSKKCYESRYGV